jgi:alpha-galactosidase
MATAIRLAVIGAGSAQFSLGLVRDLCLTDSLHGSSIVLMDVDPKRLDVVYKLARRYALELSADLRFEKTLDREALSGAGFVINTALAGGHPREEAERALLEQYGYYRGMHPSEGFFHQFDFMLTVARDMERLCPDAWLIQSSNPVYDGCTLMTRETRIKIVGLCHGPFGGIREIAHVLGLEQEHITFEAPGLNHCVWMTHFRYKGENAYPLLDEWIAHKSEAYWRTWQPKFYETQLSPAAIHMYHFFGLVPLGDTSRALWPEAWWYHRDQETKKRWWGPLGGFDSAEGWQTYLDNLNRGLEQIRATASDPQAKVSAIFPPVKSGEQIVPIIDALVNDRQGHFLVNVPNRGALGGVPDDVVVEVPALVDGKGIRPTMVGRLPEPIMLGAILPQWLAMERRLAGYRSGDPRYLMQVLLAEQRTLSWEHAEQVLGAVLRMPGNEAMAHHYGLTLPKEAV